MLTPNTRKTFLAAATDAWIFFALPGSPAEMNMQVYCGTKQSNVMKRNTISEGTAQVRLGSPSPPVSRRSACPCLLPLPGTH